MNKEEVKAILDNVFNRYPWKVPTLEKELREKLLK